MANPLDPTRNTISSTPPIPIAESRVSSERLSDHGSGDEDSPAGSPKGGYGFGGHTAHHSGPFFVQLFPAPDGSAIAAMGEHAFTIDASHPGIRMFGGASSAVDDAGTPTPAIAGSPSNIRLAIPVNTKSFPKVDNPRTMELFRMAEELFNRFKKKRWNEMFDLLKHTPKNDGHAHLEGILSEDDMISLLLRSDSLWYHPGKSRLQTTSRRGNSCHSPIPASELSKYPEYLAHIRSKISMKRTGDKPGSDPYLRFFKKVCKWRGEIIENTHLKYILERVALSAHAENTSFIELMVELSRKKVPESFKNLYEKGMEDFFKSEELKAWKKEFVEESRNILNEAEAYNLEQLGKLFQTDKPLSDPESPVTIRFICEIMRTKENYVFFAWLAAILELISVDRRIGGITIVGDQSDENARGNFDTQLAICTFLRGKMLSRSEFGKISWHALEYEAGAGNADSQELDKLLHFRHADRLGHAVGISSVDSLEKLSEAGVPVEVCFGSNQLLLGKGVEHPLNSFLEWGIPVLVCTDNKGVMTSSVTQEYLNLVKAHDLSLGNIMEFVRNGVRFSFVKSSPDGGIFEPTKKKTEYRLKPCFRDIHNPDWVPNDEAKRILQESEGARLAFRTERAIGKFLYEYVAKTYRAEMAREQAIRA